MPPHSKVRARDSEARSSRDAAALAELRSSHEATLALLEERVSELDASRRAYQGVVKELGVVASRCGGGGNDHSFAVIIWMWKCPKLSIILAFSLHMPLSPPIGTHG
jgi:hypothetical protein